MLDNATGLMNAIASSTHSLKIPASLRFRIVGACLGVVLDHHHAIILLVGARRFASAFALTRMLFEGYVRATWLNRCASDKQIQKFSEGWEPPRIESMLTNLRSANLYEIDWIKSFKDASWDSLCSYAHTGALQIQRWQTTESVEPNYSEAEVSEVLGYANLFAALASTELVR